MVNSFRDKNLVPTTRRAQQFRNQQVPNFNLALYELQIRDGVSHTKQDSYIFPLSPESIRKEYAGLTNFYDVQGDKTNNGVMRVIDIYGMTPPTFVIEGTTGWQLHQTDGYKFTGLQSISRIESLLSNFVQLNQGQIAAGDRHMYELWFFDFFRNEYWVVVPIGQQGLRQNAARPLYVNYSFRLIASRRLDSAQSSLPDNLANTLAASSASSSTTFQNFADSFTTLYSDVTAPAK